MEIVLLIYIILSFFQIIVGIFVYKDSKNRGMNPVLWTIIVIFIPNLFGLLTYLIIRSQSSNLINAINTISVENKIEHNNINNNSEANYNLCQTCGRELNKSEEKCPYCHNLVYDSYEDYEIKKENIKRSRLISIIAIIIVISMLSFTLVILTPFRYISASKAYDIIKGDFLQSNNKIETNNSVKRKYTFWNGKDEKVINIDTDGILSIEYELVSKEGILYSVIKNNDNEIIKTIPGNIHETYSINVSKNDRYTIVVAGQNTKGSYEFKWILKK